MNINEKFKRIYGIDLEIANLPIEDFLSLAKKLDKKEEVVHEVIIDFNDGFQHSLPKEMINAINEVIKNTNKLI